VTAKATFTCPVCGYDRLLEPPWSLGSGSDEICPSCGTQFGYQDSLAAHGPEARRSVQEKLRSDWVKSGMAWRSSVSKSPDGWNPGAQLEQLLASDTSDNEAYEDPS
jgi:hypothetical protein